jgi:DNA-binding NtrC family response regulator
MQNENKLKMMYSSQRSHAKRRGIEFKLTFEEWRSIWAPHLDRKKADNLVMCRYSDKGAYETGNVRIASQKENLAERSNLVRNAKFAASEASNGCLHEIVSEYEKSLVIKALESEGGHQTNAALRLGIAFRALRYLKKKHRI